VVVRFQCHWCWTLCCCLVVTDQYDYVSVGRRRCTNELLHRHILDDRRSLSVAEQCQADEVSGEYIVFTHVPAVLPGTVVLVCYLVNLQGNGLSLNTILHKYHILLAAVAVVVKEDKQWQQQQLFPYLITVYFK